MRNTIVRACIGLISCAQVTLLAAAGLGGCVNEEPVIEEQADAVQHVAISAADIDVLPGGEHLDVDLRPTRLIYHFQLHDPIDFSRVDLIAPTGSKASMETILRRMQAESLDPLSSLDERFLITADPSNFRELSAAELQELQKTGKLVRRSGSDRPQVKPQTVGDCVPQTIYVQVEVVVDGETFVFWCEHVIPCEDEGETPPEVPTDEPPR